MIVRAINVGLALISLYPLIHLGSRLYYNRRFIHNNLKAKYKRALNSVLILLFFIMVLRSSSQVVLYSIILGGSNIHPTLTNVLTVFTNALLVIATFSLLWLVRQFEDKK